MIFHQALLLYPPQAQLLLCNQLIENLQIQNSKSRHTHLGYQNQTRRLTSHLNRHLSLQQFSIQNHLQEAV